MRFVATKTVEQLDLQALHRVRHGGPRPTTGGSRVALSTSCQRDVPLSTVGAAVADGRIRYREDIIDGLENALAAFIGMLEGRNFGKALVGRFKCIGRPL
jgi:hypothetical protein